MPYPPPLALIDPLLQDVGQLNRRYVAYCKLYQSPGCFTVLTAQMQVMSAKISFYTTHLTATHSGISSV